MSFRRRLLIANSGNGGAFPEWFLQSIEGWYDIPKQKPTNEELLKNPYLIDYSGYGRTMDLKNFKFLGLSGAGEYYCDFQYFSWNVYKNAKVENVNSVKKILINSTDEIQEAIIYLNANSYKPKKIRLEISNLNGNKLYIGTKSNLSHYLEINSDGIYNFEYAGSMYTETLTIGAVNKFKGQRIGVELLPFSEDYISFDGYNDYAVNQQYPLFTDYEIIAERIWRESNNINSYVCGKSKAAYNDGAFLFENNPVRSGNQMGTVSFGEETKIISVAEKANITYQNTNTYNGNKILKGTHKDTSNVVTIAASRPSANDKADLLLKRLFIFNRTLKDDERKWVIDNLMK